MNLQCDMGEPVTGIGYQFYGIDGLLGTRVTTGITSPGNGIYIAAATPPNGTRGVLWSDDSGDKTAMAEIAPYHNLGDSEPFETARQLIYERWESLWVPGDFFPVSIEGKTITEQATGWGRLSITQGAAIEPAAGRAYVRILGICYLSIFVEGESGGTRPFTRAADRFSQIFNRAMLRSGNVAVRFQVARLEDAGLRKGYRQKNAACNFQVDCYPTD